MTDLKFNYVTENDDRFVTNHFERNELGKFECQHCEVVFDNIDKLAMAKHLRRKHPSRTKTRNMEAINAAVNVETNLMDGPPSNAETTESYEPQPNDEDVSQDEADLTKMAAVYRMKFICEYKLIGKYANADQLNDTRKKLGFNVRLRGNTITYYCKSASSNKPKDEWCYCKAKSFNLMLFQKGEHAEHCSYRNISHS